MFNHNRGLWGYSGTARRRRAADDPEHRHGRAERGDRDLRAARSRCADAWCGSAPAARLTRRSSSVSWWSSPRRYAPTTAPAARSAPGSASPPTPELVARLGAAGGGPDAQRAGRFDRSVLRRQPEAEQRWRKDGALAVEMEAATLFALAARRGLRAGALLIVTDIAAARSVAGSASRSCARPNCAWARWPLAALACDLHRSAQRRAPSRGAHRRGAQSSARCEPPGARPCALRLESLAARPRSASGAPRGPAVAAPRRPARRPRAR